MSYVRKMGASALVVAAAFAVAFAVLVSTNSNDTAEAATVELPAADASVSAAPGDTVNVVVANAFATVAITGTASGVGASFAHGGGQSVACSTEAPCDADADVAASVTVALKIDADSGEGHILLDIDGIGGTATDVTKVITVSKATLVGSLTIKTDAASDKTIPAAAGTSNLTVTVKNASSPAGLLAGQAVSVITTHGTVGCADAAGSAVAGATQACSVTTGTEGIVDILLTGGGVEGVATVTATLGTRKATATVTLFGSAKNLAAAPDQGSIEIGGSTYIVLTVTDGAGNPVAGQMITPVTAKEVEGPEGVDSPVLVTTEKATAADGDSLEGRGYSKDKPAVGKAAAIPACGDDNTDTDADTGGLQELFGPDDGTGDAGEGTNAKGECVVQVTAPEDTTDATKNATRGVHTLNFQISATIKASAMIEVAGKPASITTDVTGMVDPSSVTKITVSVFDDEDVLVGITDVKIRKVGGDGLIEDAKESTTNGKATFTFIAPSSVGTSEILITAGDVDHRLSLQIGEAPVEPEPEPEPPHVPALDRTPASTGYTLVVFNGGTVAELDAVLADVCGSSAAAYATNLGSYVSYLVGAPSVVNRAFNDLFADGIPASTPLLVGGCGS